MDCRRKLLAALYSPHWVLDLVVHRPDLLLYDDAYKVGFGLWNYPAIAFLLEIALLFGGIALYLRVTEPIDVIGRYGMTVLGLLAVVLQAYVFFGPPPVSVARIRAHRARALPCLCSARILVEGKRSSI